MALRTLAQAMIEERYFDHGQTTKIVVLPHTGDGLPIPFTTVRSPIPIDLMANRPTHLKFSTEGVGVDLCFGSDPPTPCFFQWDHVLAVQDLEGSLVSVTAITVSTIMEDRSIQEYVQPALKEMLLVTPKDEDPGALSTLERTERPKKPNPFRVIKGGEG